METSTTTQCPYCRETILEGAIKCKHCGSMLEEPAPRKKKTTRRLPNLVNLKPLGIFRFIMLNFLTLGLFAGKWALDLSKELRKDPSLPAIHPANLYAFVGFSALLFLVNLVSLLVGSPVPPFFTLLYWVLCLVLAFELRQTLLAYLKSQRDKRKLSPGFLVLFHYLYLQHKINQLPQRRDPAPPKMPTWALCLLAVLLFVVSVARYTPSLEPQNQPPQTASAPAKPPAENWNTSDLDAMSNGNLNTAIEMYQALSEEQVAARAVNVSASLVMKRPWDYYGKVICFRGTAAILQDYPPGHQVSQAFGRSAAEIVLTSDDLTIVDCMLPGDTGSIKVGDPITVLGSPVGHAEVDNQLGGKTTQLVVVGKVVTKN